MPPAMFKSLVPDGSEVFIQLPQDDGRRVLHPASLVEGEGDRYTLELEEPVAFEPEQGLLLYYEHQRKFMQQLARVIELPAADRAAMIVVETMADPILAESRECYRCPTVVEDISATLDDEAICKVLDVSQTGFAVYAAPGRAIGSTCAANLSFEGCELRGTAVVQSARESGSRTRYGLRALDGELRRRLTEVAMSVQRNQLRRASGRGA
jgi:hypothetical protein